MVEMIHPIIEMILSANATSPVYSHRSYHSLNVYTGSDRQHQHRVKQRHSNLWSQHDLHVDG